MKKLLNTLFVTTQGAYLAKEGETIQVRVEQETRLQVPIHTLAGVVCFGQVSVSPFLLGMCAEHGVGVSFLSERGRFLARMQGPVSGNVLLRREQYRRADDERQATTLACSFVLGKLANCKTVLLRAVRDHGEKPGSTDLEAAAHRLRASITQVQAADSLERVRGIEGEAALTYFGVFDALITGEKEAFFFRGRNRRPPLDNVNCLLSFVYTLLAHDVASALETVGLDPAVGFLHRDRPGRPGLALDVMEELRPVLADRLVLSLINLGMIKSKGFSASESGGVRMDDDTRKEVLVAYQKRKQEEMVHPFLEEKVPLGMLPFIQALLLARHLRGDVEAYPPFLWR
ncbi:MAG: subtype I-C CRISPR-associated endonuclease Cas1 [Deltaproteobacteria bacterium RIFOXYA12_FULL_61_11]|nr:MAG: subtype I-C CRISPR-associated endonuclease Cas1 [Deltaproteobacteria bacterium RIFOXYA12_FULL_61_11]